MNLIEWFNKAKNLNRINFGFTVAVIINLVSSISAIIYTQNVYSGLKTSYERDLMGANYVQIARYDLLMIENDVKNMILFQKTNYVDDIVRNQTRMMENIDKADPLFTGKKGHEVLTNTMARSQMYFSLVNQIVEDQKKGQWDSTALLQKAEDVFLVLDNYLDRMDNAKQRRNLSFYRSVLIIYQTNTILMLIILTISLGFRSYLYFQDKKREKGKKDCL